MKNFVMMLTLFRILSGPLVFLFSVIFELFIVAFCIFIFSSLTDFLDGYLARRYKVESLIGKVLDPIADKVFILFTFFSITFLVQDVYVGIMFAFILSREFFISGLREFAATNHQSQLMQVTYLAKIKTSVQFVSLGMFLFGFMIDNSLIIFLAKFILFLALLITLKTAIDYYQNIFSQKKGLK